MVNAWPPYNDQPPFPANGGWSRAQPDAHERWLGGDPVGRAMAATFQVRTASRGGSAFYIDNGEWLTNYHIVEDAAWVELAHGGVRLAAAVDMCLPWCDLALLRAWPPVPVPPLHLAASRLADLASVAVVGFPFGVSSTPLATRGVVLGYAPFPRFPGGVLLETYAYMNFGNSGGPIVDGYGEVVGIAKSGRGLRNRHYIEGFAVAAETIKAQLDLSRFVAVAMGRRR